MFVKHQQTLGVTMLEMLLALAIGAVLVAASMQQYSSWRFGSQVVQLNATVDQLFNAAAQFYNTNCVTGGLLDPAVAQGTSVPVSVSALVQGGYLQAMPASNILVDTSNINNAYVVQFNQYTSTRMETVCTNPPTCTTLTPVPIGIVALWRIQVSVLMKKTQSNQLATYKNYLTADCLSGPASQGGGKGGMTVQPCALQQTGNYVVFERLPDYPAANPRALSVLWPSHPLLQQFSQMYITYPMTYLTGVRNNAQYFYCPHGGAAPAPSKTGSS